jgi:hypothetical protein
MFIGLVIPGLFIPEVGKIESFTEKKYCIIILKANTGIAAPKIDNVRIIESPGLFL